MAISFRCACGRELRARDDAAGKRLKCPECGATPVVPNLAAAIVPELPDPSPFTLDEPKRRTTIEIYRVKKQAVKFRNLSVYVDGDEEDVLANGDTIAIKASPGDHVIEVKLGGAVGEYECTLEKGETLRLECEVNTSWSGPKIEVRRAGKASAARARSSQRAKNDGSIPWFTWIFIAACAAIPVVTLGGAIPGALGFGGAGGCLSAGRSRSLSPGGKAFVCFAITLCCWFGLGVLLLVVASRRR